MADQLRIGGVVIAGARVKLVEAINDDAKLIADVPLEAFKAVLPNLRGIVEWMDVTPDEVVVFFRGWTETADLVADAVHIEARTGAWLDEGTYKGFVIRAPYDEQVWSVARMAGLTRDQIDIPGLALEPDTFVVVAPVAGLSLADDIAVGGIGFTSRVAGIAPLLDFVNDGEDWAAFLGPGTWGLAEVAGEDNLFDAEQRGLQAIDGALDRIALDLAYSSVILPDGRHRPYTAGGRHEDPVRNPQVLVRGRSGRAWLRSLLSPDYAEHPARSTPDRLTAPAPGAHVRYDLALDAWRRASRSRIPVATAVALWEALEFYAAETRVGGSFSPEQLGAIDAATNCVDAIDDSQKVRVREVLHQFLNQPTAMTRLRAALVADEIPLTDGEIAAIREVREARNDFQHGDPWTDPTEESLELAKAFVNRVLAYKGTLLARMGADQPAE